LQFFYYCSANIAAERLVVNPTVVERRRRPVLPPLWRSLIAMTDPDHTGGLALNVFNFAILAIGFVTFPWRCHC
jgi:hypothetical protein